MPSTSPAASRRQLSPPAPATLPNCSGNNAAIAAGVLTLHTGTGADLSITGRADLLKSLGLTASVGSGDETVTRQRTITTEFEWHPGQEYIETRCNVNGKIITSRTPRRPWLQTSRSAQVLAAISSPTATAIRRSTYQGSTIADTLAAMDAATLGVQTATNVSGAATSSRGAPGAGFSRLSWLARCSSRPARDRRSVDQRHRQRALGAGPYRQHRYIDFVQRRSQRGPRQPVGKALNLHLLQRRYAGQRHFRRRLQRHGQDAGPAQCRAAGQQSGCDGQLGPLATRDHHHQRLCVVDPGRFWGGAIGGTLTGAVTFTIATAPVRGISGASCPQQPWLSQFNGILSVSRQSRRSRPS